MGMSILARSTVGIVAGAAMGVATIATAVTASADIFSNGLNIQGDQHQAGTSYTLTGWSAYVGASYSFYDNGTLIGSATVVAAPPTGGPNTATLQWKPTTAGVHTLRADCSLNGRPIPSDNDGPIDVTVTAAPATGSASSIPVLGGLLSSLSAQ